MTPSLVVIVPCYNEARRLNVAAFSRFMAAHPQVALLLVDDGSADDTISLLEQLQSRHPRQCQVHALQVNCGKAEAVRQGMLRALQSAPQFVGFWDADLATPLSAIPQLTDVLVRLPAVQAVIGSRMTLAGRQVRRRWLRGFLGRCFSRTASAVIGASLRDTHCGAKLFRASPALAAAFAAPFLSRWIFDVEVLARLSDGDIGPLRDAIFEYPLDQWDEVGQSKVRPKDFLRAAGDLGRIFVDRVAVRRRRRADAFPVRTDEQETRPRRQAA